MTISPVALPIRHFMYRVPQVWVILVGWLTMDVACTFNLLGRSRTLSTVDAMLLVMQYLFLIIDSAGVVRGYYTIRRMMNQALLDEDSLDRMYIVAADLFVSPMWGLMLSLTLWMVLIATPC